MSNQNRNPRGVPTGGQFAAKTHAEVNIDLGAQVNAALDGLADHTQAMKRPTRVELEQYLAGLEVEFAEAGGRGVELAEEIDGIRAELARMDGTPDSEGRYITWADEDGDFLLSNGGFGNPGCDSCGMEDAVVRVDGRYLCELHTGDNGIERPEPDFRGDDPYDIADTSLGQKLVSGGNPAYPNGRCDACGQGLSDSGSCRDFECSNGPDEPDEQTLDQMRDHPGDNGIEVPESAGNPKRPTHSDPVEAERTRTEAGRVAERYDEWIDLAEWGVAMEDSGVSVEWGDHQDMGDAILHDAVDVLRKVSAEPVEAPTMSDPSSANEAREMAIAWQSWVSEQSLSYGEIHEWTSHFEEVGERFGLTEEFKENGII